MGEPYDLYKKIYEFYGCDDQQLVALANEYIVTVSEMKQILRLDWKATP